MADFQYERLSEDDRRAAVEGRLVGLESTHYQARLDLISASNEDQVRSAQGRATDLEKQILALREELASLTA